MTQEPTCDIPYVSELDLKLGFNVGANPTVLPAPRKRLEGPCPFLHLYSLHLDQSIAGTLIPTEKMIISMRSPSTHHYLRPR